MTTNASRLTCALLGILLPFTAQASSDTISGAANNSVSDANWKPLIAFAGNGDRTTAIQRLREIDQLQSAMMNNTRYDTETETFMTEMWKLIESFNLRKLHATLPINVDEWNQLSLKGERNDKEYNITMTHQKSLDDVKITDFGDSYVMLKTKTITAPSGLTHYVIDNQIKAGFGAQSWQSAQIAANDTLQLISSMAESTTASGDSFKEKVKSLSPELDASDINVLSSAWSSFPNVLAFMSSIGQINDVIVEGKSSATVKHLNLSFSLDKNKTEEHYPALSSYLDKLENLMDASFEVFDEHGRLIKMSIDTTTMNGQIEVVVGNDGIYPIRDDKPMLAHLYKFGENAVTLTGVMNSNIEILGVKTEIANLTSTIEYTPNADKVGVKMRINQAPTIAVGGAALGFIPTPMIDLFMPSNLKEIIGKFFDVACNGNNGEGIITSLELSNIKPSSSSSSNAGFTQISANTSLETFSNLFVRIGMNIVNSRLIPNDAASKDIDLFIDNARVAFNNDVDIYEASTPIKSQGQPVAANTLMQ